MNKQELALLERAFAAEVDAAINGGLYVIQPRGTALAEKMVAVGLLARRTEELGGRFPVTVKGYGLTELGRMTYCMQCDEPDQQTAGADQKRESQ